jgi:hypothetical protein
MLIAAAAIGLVVILIVIALVLWRVRNKKNKAAASANLDRRKDEQIGLSPEPKLPLNQQTYNIRAPLGRPWSNTMALNPPTAAPGTREKERWDMNSSAGSLLYKPAPTFSRAGMGSTPSLLGMQTQPSRSPFPPPNPLAGGQGSSSFADRSVLHIDAREHGRFHPSFHQVTTSASQTRRASIASSSPVLPIEGPGLSDRAAHSHSSTRSEKRRSSTPSIIEFSSELAPLANFSGRRQRRTDEETGLPDKDGKPSRFSWTNSHSPKTPGAGDPASRFSIATSTSSVPRYRTVESWVGNQTNRLDERNFQEYLEKEIEHRISVAMTGSSQNGVGGSPELNSSPSDEEKEKKTPPVDRHGYFNKSNNGSPERNNPGESGIRYSNFQSYQQKQRDSGRENGRLRVPQARDSSAYMVHPGTKVVSPRVSFIPSEILDSKLVHSAL